MQCLDFSDRQSLIKQLSVTCNCECTYNGMVFKLHKDVLVPHIDTLSLIEHAINIIRSDNTITTIADIGTGTGFIALNLAKEFPNHTFYATDINPIALELTEHNAKANNLKNVKTLYNTTGGWLDELTDLKIDMIVSNPPFVGITEYCSEHFHACYPEVALEPSEAICTCDSEGDEPFILMLTTGANMHIPYFVFQGNAANMPRLLDKLKAKYKGIYNFKTCTVNGMPRVFIASM